MPIRDLTGTIEAQSQFGEPFLYRFDLAGSFGAVSTLVASFYTQVANGGFETPGVEPGDADGWLVLQKAGVELYAAFAGAAFEFAFEGFEQAWDNDDFKFAFVGEGTDIGRAIWLQGNKDEEDFEDGWLSNESWDDELLSTGTADFGTGPAEPFEGFERQWSTNEGNQVAFGDLFFVVVAAADGDWQIYFSPSGYPVAADALDAVLVSYTASGGESADDIADGIADAINNSGLPINAVSGSPVSNALILYTSPANGAYFVDLGHERAVAYGSAPIVPDGGDLWLIATAVDASTTFGVFNTTTDAFEAFEREWRSNENFKFAFVGPPTDLQFAEFDDDLGPTVQYEDFEDGWPLVVMKTI